MTAREAGASVLVLECAPIESRGGNSRHTRNLRCMHAAPEDVLIDSYGEDEYWDDLWRVTAGRTMRRCRLTICESARLRPWMKKHGVRFQSALGGTLHLGRTNAFFLGGGKALLNSYYRSAETLGVHVRYGAEVVGLEIEDRRFIAAIVRRGESTERIEARVLVAAAGGLRIEPRMVCAKPGGRRPITSSCVRKVTTAAPGTARVARCRRCAGG